jgi:hypothetical protein
MLTVKVTKDQQQSKADLPPELQVKETVVTPTSNKENISPLLFGYIFYFCL